MGVKERIPFKAIVIYCLIFYTVWTLVELFLKPYIDTIIVNPYIAHLIETGVIKNIVWVLPAWLLLKRNDSCAYISLKELFKTPVNFIRVLPFYALVIAYPVVVSILLYGKLSISATFSLNSLITVAFVGITEEMVFRGWLLNVTLNRKNKWIPILINAVAFLAIHFPRWIIEGQFLYSFISFGFLGIIILSVIFSISFVKSKNIFIPISLHMLYDLLAFMLY